MIDLLTHAAIFILGGLAGYALAIAVFVKGWAG